MELELRDDKTHFKYIYGSRDDFYDCEVIGKIYDNPKLLKGGKIQESKNQGGMVFETLGESKMFTREIIKPQPKEDTLL